MALFNQSVKLVSAVISEIADTIGASADSEMRLRGMNSLNAAIGHTNMRARWDFLQTEAPPTLIYAPFQVGGVTASAGQTSALAPASHGIFIDDVLSMTGVIAGTRITATAAGTIGFDTTTMTSLTAVNQVVTASLIRDTYALPSDFKISYNVRLYGSQRILTPVRRRVYDLGTPNPFTATTPLGYDLYAAGGKGRIKILPPPTAADVMKLDYYRRMTVASATADATIFDVPQDIEPFTIAYAKWHFLTDKGEGRLDQANTWLTYADAGFKQMIAEQTNHPDEILAFLPAAAFSGYWNTGPNSTSRVDWDYSG